MTSILVVDDDDVVRQLTRRILETHGYRVFTAPNGMLAMLVSEERPGEISLLVCAVQLPDMRGRELAKLASAAQPQMQVLFAVGASEPPPAGATDVVGKPFTAERLLARVRAKVA